jgi:hypothetical protein
VNARVAELLPAETELVQRNETQAPAEKVRPKPSSRALGRLPEIVFGMACGSMIIAISFARARSGAAEASHLYWVGQAIVYLVPGGFLLFRKSVMKVEAIGVAFLAPITSYLTLLYYSPTRFRFLDEFGHVQTAQTILATHHLFHANTAILPSPQYPGLEIVTTAIVAISHLSITAAGMIVAGSAHVLAGVCLYFLVFELTAKYRVSALAALIYATGPHYQFFDSYFLYETIAIPFLLLTILAVVKMLKSEGRAANTWGAVAFACGAVTAVCHHVTSYMLLLILFAFCVAQPFVSKSARSWRLPVVLIGIAAVVAVWDLKVATTTVAYFTPVVHALFSSITGSKSVVKGHSLGAFVIKRGASGSAPIADLALEYVDIGLLMILTPIGVRVIWKNKIGKFTAALGLAIASLSIFIVVVARVVVSNSTLATRSLSFVMIPASFACALAVENLRWGTLTQGRHIFTRLWTRLWKVWSAPFWTGVVALLALGGIAGGYPNFYARLPGPFLVSGWERGVDEHNLDLTAWMATRLTPDNGVASDFFTSQMISALGDQRGKRNIADLFLSSKYTSADRTIVKIHRVVFVVVDTRISQQLPAAGFYFSDDPGNGLYSSPIPKADLTKFESIPGVSRVFSDGTILIYDLTGSTKPK